MKKFISMALALVMTLSLYTFIAPEASADFTDADELSSQYAQQAADVIQVIEVMDGYDDGTFRPTAGLTRQAAAKIICNMILGPTTARALPTNANPFPDVLAGNQFSGYISYCAQQGIISGYADGTFRGGDPLSGYAYLKMLLGALGYDARHEGFVGDNWKVNVAKIALGIGLNKGIEEDLDGTTQVTREAAAIYAFNTLQADMVEYESRNTLEINGVQVSMGGGNAIPQTWSTSATQASNINDARSDGDGNRAGNNIVQFAERYFDKLERSPKQWDTYTQDDFGRPSIKWKWKGVDVGTYSRDPDATFVGGVDVNEIYEALVENTGMSSGSSSASLYINSAHANRGWYQTATGKYDGNPTGYGEFKVERANDSGLEDEIARTRNAAGEYTIFSASTNDREGGRPSTATVGAGQRNVNRIGDGTIIEVFRNDATNHVDVCVISVYGGKVDAVKGATTKKDAYVVLSTNHNAFPDRYPDTIATPANREFETEDFDEDDVVAFTYSDSAKEIKSMYLMSAESGALQSKVTGKNLRLDSTVYKYGKEYTFDDLTEASLGNKSSYIVYLDANDYVLWVEEDEFSVEDYVLIERITIETSVTVNNQTVTTKTASVLGTAATTADATDGSTLPQNREVLQKAYNQSKDAVGNSSWDAQAQVRYSNGTRRTVTLDDSKNYRTSAISDNNYIRTTAAGRIEQYMPDPNNNNTWAWVDRGAVGDVNIVYGLSGDDGNWIAYPFTAGRIVRISSNSNGYRLHSINDSRYQMVRDASLYRNWLYGGTGANMSRQSFDLDSETHFVIEDNAQGSYKSYLGVKNAPTVSIPAATSAHADSNPTAFVYLDGNTAKLVFVTNAWEVSNSSNDIVFLVANSTSNEVESDDGVYYEVNAVDKNEIKTLFVKKVVDANGNNAVSFTGRIFTGNTYSFTPGVGRTEQKYRCVILNNVKYDSNDFITSGNFNSSDDTATRYHGIRRVNDEEIRVNTYFSTSTLKDVAENVRVYFVDGDDIEQIDYSEIVNDTTDYVYLVEDDDGEVTHIFIVDYDGSDDDTGVDSTTPAPTPTTYADGVLQDTSNGQATAYTLHLTNPSTALPAVTPATIEQYIASSLNTIYPTTTANFFQYNSTLSSVANGTYVFDWMRNSNASGIQVTVTVVYDAVAPTQPTTSGS